MKYLIFSCIILITIGSSFINKEVYDVEKVLELVTTQFHAELDNCEQSIDQLVKNAAALNDSPSSIEALQSRHLQSRENFKRVEALLEYFDHYSIKKTINGAPLPSVEPKVPEVIVVEPVGLQVLDELIFGENIFAEKENILALAKQLKADFKKVKAYQKNIQIDHRHIFEATRQEIVRIVTLGLTGFDTPGSLNAIPEAIVSLKQLSSTIAAYYPLVSDQENLQLVASIKILFEESIRFLKKENNFDNLDRLHFIKSYSDPLYAKIYQLQLALNIETISEVNDQVQPINEESTSIFDPHFLNKDYFANIDFSKEVTKKRMALGKLLFFDPILSSNNERACSSCHQAEKAFTDGQVKSLAINGQHQIQRNAPSLINSVYSEKYFYDLREPNLERQINHVVLDSQEFNTSFMEIIDKLNQSVEYQDLFKDAYGDQANYTLSKWSISDALASYVASLSYFNSPFDRYVRGETTSINESVKRGFNLFMGKAACGTCHFAPNFSGAVPPLYDESESEVLGVPLTKDTLNPEIDHDPGRSASGRLLDQTPFYVASFKTVTIRNIAQTAPYMHNGVYNTLEEVIDFYNKGGGVGLGIDVPHQTLAGDPLNLTAQEQKDLIHFMEALSDEYDTTQPLQLPSFDHKEEWNKRVVGGVY